MGETNHAPPTIALIIDMKQLRPACVLLQAAYRCPTGPVSTLFDAWTWLLAPTDDMRRVEGTMDEWRRFATETNARHAKAGRRSKTDPAAPSLSAGESGR